MSCKALDLVEAKSFLRTIIILPSTIDDLDLSFQVRIAEILKVSGFSNRFASNIPAKIGRRGTVNKIPEK